MYNIRIVDVLISPLAVGKVQTTKLRRSCLAVTSVGAFQRLNLLVSDAHQPLPILLSISIDHLHDRAYLVIF